MLRGRVAEVLATADASIQTQRYTIRPSGPVPELPENLAVQVELDRTAPHLARTLPRGAVLTDETQTEFWVMRLLNDSTAVKVPVQVGAQQRDRVEIKKPVFNPKERILLSGNFGLDDTAAVKVTRPVAAERNSALYSISRSVSRSVKSATQWFEQCFSLNDTAQHCVF